MREHRRVGAVEQRHAFLICLLKYDSLRLGSIGIPLQKDFGIALLPTDSIGVSPVIDIHRKCDPTRGSKINGVLL